MNSKNSPLFILLVLLPVIYLVYTQGYSGVFMLDDIVNLSALSLLDYQDLRGTLPVYLAENARQVSFLSYMLDSAAFPNDPSRFIRTNVLFHLIAGLILILCFFEFGEMVGLRENKRFLVGVLAGLIWIASPYLVSTVLYVVQRMTILSTLFCFLSLLCYLKARNNSIRSDRVTFFSVYILFPFFGVLAVLSKQNAAILLLVVLSLDLILYGFKEDSRLWRFWRVLYLVFPTLLLPYIIYNTGVFSLYETRDFGVIERVMFESQILLKYVYFLVVPQIQYTGVNGENFIQQLSDSTLVSIGYLFGISLICFLAYRVRRKYPVITVGIAFYLIGHLIESTVLPLELYFEHRNYFPSAFLYYSIVFYAVDRFSGKGLLLIAMYMLMFLVCLYGRVSLWGNPKSLAEVWIEQNPKSSRNYQFAISLYDKNDPEKALEIIKKGLIELPDDAFLNAGNIIISCQLGINSDSSWNNLEGAMKSDRAMQRTGLIENIDSIVYLYGVNICHGKNLSLLASLILESLNNPFLRGDEFSEHKARLLIILSFLSYLEDEVDNSVRFLVQAYLESPTEQVYGVIESRAKEYGVSYQELLDRRMSGIGHKE